MVQVNAKNTKVTSQKIYESWAPTIKKSTGVNNTEKLKWMSEMAHNYKLNESNETYGGGTTFPGYNNLFNTVGIGDARFPQKSMNQGAFTDPATRGTGDVWADLLDMGLQAAARTVGTELVNTMSISTPNGAVKFLDYVYAGGTNPYGPAGQPGYANPEAFLGKLDGNQPYTANQVYGHFHDPAMFKASVVGTNEEMMKTYEEIRKKLNTDAKKFRSNHVVVGADGPTVAFVGISRLNGDLIFRVIKPGTKSLGEAFAEGLYTRTTGYMAPDEPGDVNTPVTMSEGVTITIDGVAMKVTNPRLVSAVEDHIQGFTGAGVYDNDPWAGTYQDGLSLYEPMSRGVGERTYPRQMAAQIFVRRFEVGTYSVSVSVTDEMFTDYQKQWNIDIFKMLKEAAANEISQSINKHILSRLFGMGWKNHIDIFASTGTTFNVNFVDDQTKTPAYAAPIYTPSGASVQGWVNTALPYSTGLAVSGSGASVKGTTIYDTQDALLKRVMNQILVASNWIHHRGRRGPATHIVTGVTVASVLQLSAQYMMAPIANTINQNAGSLYPAGKLAGMEIYVDPMMDPSDTRVLVMRKGALNEPGVVFAPYQLAHTIEFTPEGTGGHKAIVKSRYALVNTGFYPELNYITFDVKLGIGTPVTEAAGPGIGG